MRRIFLSTAFALIAGTFCLAQQIPVGTVLPVMTGNTLDSSNAKPGDRIAAKLMQDVRIASGEKFRAGTRIEGRVVEVPQPSAASGARVLVRFDHLIANGKEVPINVSLRAIASMAEVFDAQLPWSTFDEYGTSSSDWNTVQVGGAAVYRGDGTVRTAMEIIGHSTDYGAVTAKLIAAPKLGCPAEPAASQQEQSLWVFSPWACGTYGFEDLSIAHHGNSAPVGTIELSGAKSVHVRGGSGWLLRVVETQP